MSGYVGSIKALGRHSYIGGDGVATTPTYIGAFTSIAPRVKIEQRENHACVANPLLVSQTTHRHIPGYPHVDSLHGVTIGNDVWIGDSAILLAPLTIGDGARIGAYSVVAKSVPPYAVVVGNPATIKKYRFDKDTIHALLTMQWWDWPDEVIAERADDLRDVRVLVTKYAYHAGDA